ncbi:hypothetical protein EDD16DRAFT_1730754 [Pisolithus croceorrhizus]|nr:hypothetical protein EDD16DRAFT_1730754 [Pisolithus croceorrhizus]
MQDCVELIVRNGFEDRMLGVRADFLNLNEMVKVPKTLEKGAQASPEGIQHAVNAAQAAINGNNLGPLVATVTFHCSGDPPPTRSINASTECSSLMLHQVLRIEHPSINFTFFLPATIEGNFRASVVDYPPNRTGSPKVREEDPNKNGLKREELARRCKCAIDRGGKKPRRPTIVGFNAPGHDTQHESGVAAHSTSPRTVWAFVLNSVLNVQQQQQQQQQSSLTARFIPGKGIQYLPQGNHGSPPYNRSTSQGSVPFPLSPTTGRPIQPQQGPFYPQQIQRRSSDAPVPNLNDLGKGVQLSSVPASWPLYIVEFKAGRTDLFYLTDLSLDIRVGDLVIVEADRGKDLGTVVNDSITLKEVEAFEREQRERVAHGDGGPLSPGGQQSSKKEINPKMIYGKAQPRDRQYGFFSSVIDLKLLTLRLCRQLLNKAQDEAKALQLCQNKMQNISEKRIDFRELVRELFSSRSLTVLFARLYKTRIWMASLQGSGGYEQ